MEIRWAKNFERSERRFKRGEERMDRAGERMDKFDKQLQVTRELVETGMKMLVRLGARVDHLTATVNDLARTQKAFLRGMGNGKNGHNGSPPSRVTPRPQQPA